MRPASVVPFKLQGKRVFVAGHRGMVGAALVRRLENEHCEVLAVGRERLDLRRQADVEKWFESERPDAVFFAAAKVGGIHANNTYPADFIRDNLLIQDNVIEAARLTAVEKLLFLGSSCIYPREAPQPIKEEYLLTGPLESTNEWYAIAKIAGLKLCEAYRKQYGCDFISVMPTNLYGPGDNFHPEHSHVPAALLRRFHEAKLSGAAEVVVWGTGQVRREFMHVDDLADACVFIMKNYSEDRHINVGTSSDLSIAEFAELIAKTVGYAGRLVYDDSRPDGTPRKLLDSTKLKTLGWLPSIPLEQGLRNWYSWYVASHDQIPR